MISVAGASSLFFPAGSHGALGISEGSKSLTDLTQFAGRLAVKQFLAKKSLAIKFSEESI